MKPIKIVIGGVFCLLIGLANHEPQRNYTNLTVQPYPDIAIDFVELMKHKDPKPMKWKLSKKRLTRRVK